LLSLAERAQRVYLLLDTLNDPYPTPRGSIEPGSGPSPSHYVPCETCRRRGEVRARGGWVICLVCDGTGWKRREHEPPWDAYMELPLDEANELPRATSPPRLAPIDEEGFAWEVVRRRYDRHGSYRELRRHLDWLSLTHPGRYLLVRRILVDHEPREIDRRTGVELRVGVVLIARRMPIVKVPGWLIERGNADQNRTVEALADAGMKPGAIARELGLTREVVKRKLRKKRQRSNLPTAPV
jgi:hypothetical protein